MRQFIRNVSSGIILMLVVGVLIVSRQERTPQTSGVGVVAPVVTDARLAEVGAHLRESSSPTSRQMKAIAQAGPVSVATTDPAVPAPVVADAEVIDPVVIPKAQLFGHDHPTRLRDIPPGAFRDAVAALDDANQTEIFAQLDALAIPHADVASLRVGPAGGLFYACHALQAAQVEVQQVPAVVGAATVPVSPSPLNLHSRPGSTKVLYLAFHGPDISGTKWNSGTAPLRCRAWSADSDRTTFSTAELATIEEIWKRVSESFAPYDIDVTTVRPSVWTATTGYAVITPTISRDNVALPHAGYGGVAYLNVFGWPEYVYGTKDSYSVLWVKEYTDQSTMYMAATIAHEFGHNLGLSHDGLRLPGTDSAYYGNHAAWPGSYRTWGPLMGGATINDISQWSRGEYYGANNPQDDLQVMEKKLGYRPVDRGATLATASALKFSATDVIQDGGVIERTGSEDFFQFSGRPGRLSVTAQPFQGALSAQWGSTLDPEIQLLTSNGAVLARNDDPVGVGASIIYDLPATGTYYLRVAPTAATVGKPTLAEPNGYTRYGVLGSYTLTGTLASPSSPSLRVTGNGTVIPAGTTIAQVATGSDFGTLAPAQSTSRTFVLQNIGSQALNLTGAKVVGSSAFVLGSITDPLLAPGGQRDLVVSFPGVKTTGQYQATLSIPAGDVAPAFTCTLAVRVVAVPMVVNAVDPTAEFPGNSVTLTGSRLTGAAVSCNGVSATVLNASDTRMTIRLPATTAGATTLDVSGPNGTASMPITVCGIPVVTAANPRVVEVSGGTQVTFGGAWLTNAAITIGGKPVTVLSTSADGVVCKVPALAAGTYDVQVSGPGVASCPSRANSTAKALITYAMTPTLIALAPDSGPVAGGTQITLTGTSLGNAAILIDNQLATIVSRTATSSVVTVPPHAAGVVQVVASNAGFPSAGLAYTYREVPQISALTPTPLPLTGGALTITGTALDEASVSLAGVPLPTVTAPTSTAVTVQFPAQSVAGTYEIRLQTPGGSATGSVTVIANPAPPADLAGESKAGGAGGCGLGGGLALLLIVGMCLWGVQRMRE